MKKGEKEIKDRNLEKVKFVGEVFKVGVRKQFENPYTLGTATFIGIARGLGRGGGLMRGIEAGAVALVAMSVVSGVGNIITNLDSIKSL